MDLAVIVILVSLFVASLGILILRLRKRLATFLLVLGGLAATIAVSAAMTAQAQATREAARAAEIAAAGQAATSAATSIIAFLLGLVVLFLLATICAVVGWLWWQKRQRRARLQEILEMAQLHALLNDARLPGHRTGRPALAGLPQAGGNVFVLPSQAATPSISLDDLARALQAAQAQANPLADPFPPDDEWRVLR